MRCVSLLLVLLAAGCTGSTAPAPTASGPSRDPLAAPVDVIRVVAGQPDTLSVADVLGDVTAAVPPESGAARARLKGDRLIVSAETAGLHLIPITVDRMPMALAVQAAPAFASPPLVRLDVRLLGTAPGDPSQLQLAVREVDEQGRETLPLGLDDEESIVALDGNRLLDDNAVYFDPGSGELALDLDALDGGLRRLRLAVRDGARVSRWVEVDVRDHRLVAPAERDGDR